MKVGIICRGGKFVLVWFCKLWDAHLSAYMDVVVVSDVKLSSLSFPLTLHFK